MNILPKEVLKDIFYEFVSHEDVFQLSNVCQYWRDLTYFSPHWSTATALQPSRETYLNRQRQIFVLCQYDKRYTTTLQTW